jgi:hypothetical protein
MTNIAFAAAPGLARAFQNFQPWQRPVTNFDLNRKFSGQLGFLEPPADYSSGDYAGWGVSEYPTSGGGGYVYDAGNLATVTVNGSESGSSNTMPIFNGVASLVSQALAAFGKNPTQQVAAGVTPIGQGYSPAAATSAQAALAAAQRQPINATGAAATGSIDATLQGALTWAQNNIFVLAVVGVGLYLFTREPPRRR